MGADQGIEQVFGQLPEETFAGMMELLDAPRPAGLRGPVPALARAGAAQLLDGRSRGGRGHIDARRPDAVHHLRRSGPGDGPEPELGGVRLPGPDSRADSDAEDDRADRAGRGRADARGRRLHRRLRRGRRRDRRDARQGGPEGVRRRGGRLLQRVRLRPARAVRLREHVLARRAHSRRPTST